MSRGGGGRDASCPTRARASPQKEFDTGLRRVRARRRTEAQPGTGCPARRPPRRAPAAGFRARGRGASRAPPPRRLGQRPGRARRRAGAGPRAGLLAAFQVGALIRAMRLRGSSLTDAGWGRRRRRRRCSRCLGPRGCRRRRRRRALQALGARSQAVSERRSERAAGGPTAGAGWRPDPGGGRDEWRRSDR